MGTNQLLNVGLLSKTKPTTIDDLRNGQGTILYNHNVKQVAIKSSDNGTIEIVDDNTDSTMSSMWQYDSLRVEYPVTADNIYMTLLTAKYPANRESKLVNEYQSAVLGLIDESYKKPYEDFLRDRLAIRMMIDEDCASNNIPVDL